MHHILAKIKPTKRNKYRRFILEKQNPYTQTYKGNADWSLFELLEYPGHSNLGVMHPEGSYNQQRSHLSMKRLWL